MPHENSYQIGDAQTEVAWERRAVAGLTRVGERVGNTLVYSSAYLAVVAMAEMAVVMALLAVEANPAPVVVALVAFAVYSYDRIVDVDADAVSSPDQAAFVRRHRDVLYLLASAAYAVAVTLSLLGGPLALGVTLIPGLFGVLYASDWMPDVGSSVRRFKDLLVVNTSMVAFAWAVTLTFLPLAFTGGAFGPTAGIVFGYLFLRSFVDAELPNVGDVAGDREAGVSTIPVVFGVRRTRHVLYAVDLLSLGMVGYAVATEVLPAALGGALCLGVVYSLGVVSRVGRTDDSELLTIASECEYLVVVAATAVVVFGP